MAEGGVKDRGRNRVGFWKTGVGGGTGLGREVAFFSELREELESLAVVDLLGSQFGTVGKWGLGGEVERGGSVGDDDGAFGARLAKKDSANAVGAFLGVGSGQFLKWRLREVKVGVGPGDRSDLERGDFEDVGRCGEGHFIEPIFPADDKGTLGAEGLEGFGELALEGRFANAEQLQ